MGHALLDWNGLCCVVLKCTMLHWTEMDYAWNMLIEMDRVGLKWTMLRCTEMDHATLD